MTSRNAVASLGGEPAEDREAESGGTKDIESLTHVQTPESTR